MRSWFRPVWLLVGLALAVAACGQGVTRDSLVTSFIEANPEASATQSECVVDRLISQYELPALEVELTAESVSPEFEESQFRAMFVCGLEGDVADQIQEQLVANGVAADDAPCVSEGLVDQLTDSDIDVLLSGEITEQFYSKFFDAMQACGAIDQ